MATPLVALVVASLLYLNLDSGLLTPERASKLISMPLCGLAAIFGAGGWAAAYSGQTGRARLMTGLAIGVGGYGLLRLALP